ncbi:MAG: helix-turn-helix transcriptional regulator [Firmicutes bacterium]|nr:helix-turn-helix transcriptional regulator [Clostridia bacterium]MBS5022182.1 helix-turn-helix transcriptional regulator [Bacillota bacterium]
MTYKRIRELHNISLVPHSYYHNKFDNTFSMDMHCHQYIELMYCRSGEMEMELLVTNANGKVKKETLTLSEKQFILLDAGLMHRLIIRGNSPAVISNIEWTPMPIGETDRELSSLIHLDVRSFFDRFDGLKRFANTPAGYLVALDSENLEHCLIYYIDLILENKDSLAQSCSILARFIQLLMEIDKCLTPSNLATGITYIKKAQDYIKNNFNRNLTVDDIAGHAGINKAYLQRLFNAYTGMSVMQSLNNFRITKCKRILIETNLTIDEICSHVGFNNRQQLIYEFKMQTGTTPTSYRNEYTNKNFRHTPLSEEYISYDIHGNLIK